MADSVKNPLPNGYQVVVSEYGIEFVPKGDEKHKPKLTWPIRHALEEGTKPIEKEKPPAPDILDNRRELTSVCCDAVDATRSSKGSRTESFDQIHSPVHETIDAALDRQPVEIATQETRSVDEYIHNNSLKLLPEEKSRLYALVNKHSEELMEKHSNLNRIGISPVLSRKKGFEKKTCIVMYCSSKGKIPPNESKFPTKIENTPVDVREGCCSLFSLPGPQEYNDPLRIGISIGGKNMLDVGTLGPFVVEAKHKSSMGFLTCQHIFPSAEVGSQVVQPSDLHNRADTRVRNTTCGEILSMCMKDIQYNGKPTSVDVAYVVINQREPKELKLPEILERLSNDFGGTLRMGQPKMHVEVDTNVYKLGQTTGLTAGCFETSIARMNIGENPYRNVYMVSSDTEFASHGDSGSAVFTVNDKVMHVIGLLLGGTNDSKICYVIPIGAALQAVGPQLEIHQFIDETGSGVHDLDGDPPCDNTSSSL